MASESTADVAAPPFRAELRRGVVAAVPLLVGAVPFGIVFAVGARATAFGVVETQALSMLVFAASDQLAVVTLAAAGAAPAAIVLVALGLNLRHVLSGLSLAARLGRRTRVPRPVLAFFLTDEACSPTIATGLAGRGGDAFFLGAGLGLYLPFAVATLTGSLLASLLPDPAALGVAVER